MSITHKSTAAELGAQADDDSAAVPEPPAPLTDDATLEELAAAAEAFRQRAGAADARAERARARAHEVVTAAEAEAARIAKTARTEAQRLQWVEATAAEREAEKHGAQARQLAEAVRCKTRAAGAVQHGLALAEEHQQLTGQAENLDTRLAELASEQRDLQGQLGTALEAADVDAITTLRGRIAAIEEASEALTRQRDTARARMDAIGTDAGQGELFNALNAVRRDIAEARKMLNLAFPERPEAEADRGAAELMDALGAVNEFGSRLAEEQKQRKPQGQTNVQRSGNTILIQSR